MKTITKSYPKGSAKIIKVHKAEIKPAFSISGEVTNISTEKRKKQVKIDIGEEHIMEPSVENNPDNLADKKLLAEIEKKKQDLNI